MPERTFFERFSKLLADDAVFYTLLILLVALASFGLGRLSLVTGEVSGQPALVSLSPAPAATPVESPHEVAAKAYVGSVNGTKYHLPTCPGAGQIKEENKIYFATKEEAQSSGYTPAANCPGL